MNAIRNVIGVVALGSALLASPAHAGGVGEYAAASGRKLAHGIGSILYAPAEVVVTPIAFAADQDRRGRSIVAAVYGLPMGALNAGARAMLGASEALTFPVADPSHPRPWVWEPISTFRMVPSGPVSRVGSIEQTGDAIPR